MQRRQVIQSTTAVAVLGTTLLQSTAHAAYNPNAFAAKTIADAVKAYGGGALIASADINLTAPDIAENGSVVPLGAATNLPNIKQLLILVEKNPSPLVAAFGVNPAIDANIATRAKMGQSSDVYAVAITNDGRALFSKKEVKVTLGGCGG